MSDALYPKPTRELVSRRAELAPATHDAFQAFSKQVFADGALPEKAKQLIAVAAELRAGGMYSHSVIALDAIGADAHGHLR